MGTFYEWTTPDCQDKLYIGIQAVQKESLEDHERTGSDTIQQDLKSIGMTWEVVQQLAVKREGWRRRVAQCAFDTA